MHGKRENKVYISVKSSFSSTFPLVLFLATIQSLMFILTTHSHMYTFTEHIKPTRMKVEIEKHTLHAHRSSELVATEYR